MSGKASKAEVLKRIEAVYRLRLGGAEYHDIAEYADALKDFDGTPKEPWNLKPTQLREYISRADALFKERVTVQADHLMARHIAQRRRLFAYAMERGDVKAALSALKDEAKLLGLYDRDPKGGTLDAILNALPADISAALREGLAALLAGGSQAGGREPPALGAAGGPEPDPEPRGDAPGPVAGGPADIEFA